MASLRTLFYRHLAQTSDSPFALEIERAQGMYLYSPDGKKYLDLIAGVSVSNLGYQHPAVVKAVHEQVDKYMHLLVYGELIQAPQVLLTEALCHCLPSSLNNVYLVNSGAEAVEGALKLAKRYTHRPEIIAFVNAYHGSTHGALSVTGNEELKRAYRPLLPGVRFIRLNEPDDLAYINQNTAAVIIEPVMGEAGVRPAEASYLHALRSRCSEQGALLIMDEVQTCMGRTGSMFAFEKAGTIPDILVLAKGFGGGMNLGAFVSSKDIMTVFTKEPVLGHITTFGGHPVACAAALANLQVILETRIFETVPAKEQLFRSLLVHPFISEIRGMGLLMAVELNSSERMHWVLQHCMDKGILMDWFLFCDTALRISPPLIITEEEIRMACRTILEMLDECPVR